MSSQLPVASASDGDSGGRGPRRAHGGRSRRAKNLRYRLNTRERSRLLITSWNAEGLRPKTAELASWLSSQKVDVCAVQEAQPGSASNTISIPGYQTAVVSKRARGRRADGPVKGGDVLILIRDGLKFLVITESPLLPQDDTTEWCATRVFLPSSQVGAVNCYVDIYCVYRPPIRSSEEDRRTDFFALDRFPTREGVIVLGDINGRHPLWDTGCTEPDRIGQLVEDWLLTSRWEILNSGEPTRAGYGEGALTCPDVALCHRSTAARCSWSVGADLGSDHLPMEVRLNHTGTRPRRIRKTRWAFHKAEWTQFEAACEEKLATPPTEPCSTDALAEWFVKTILEQAQKFVPRGARADPKPWAIDPELVTAIEERRAARDAHQANPSRDTREEWKMAKRRAAEAEEEARRTAFRSFATNELNKRTNVGRVTKILKKMEGATQSACPGQAICGDHGRLAVEDRQKASAFVRTYASVSRQVRSKKEDRRTKAGLKTFKTSPCHCGGDRADACQAFSAQELENQIRQMKTRKAPGPDGICGEHLQHLGPIARARLLDLINRSWLRAEVPTAWRRARIIPILKSGKDPKLTGSYRPISLTSHLAKLVERVVGARLNHLIERDGLVPPEQVGFRRGRAAEEHVGRLIQQVQDGWNKPKPRGRPVEGRTAEKFVLLSFDFARAYDTIDHRMLRLKLHRLSLPKCMIEWIFQFLRDRRARVEINGTSGEERIFRAGLPQGSVLAPTLFTLWSADLAAELREVPGTSVFMYADDTATLSTGSSLPIARARAQQAADTLARWAVTWKANIAAQKTQALVLSQWAQDAKDFSIKVAGATVEGRPHLKILGVTLDRTLHFGEHCASIRRKVKPRTAQLRKMTGRSWGLRESQLRTVANGYVRGALEYCAAAWMPAASPTHLLSVERELRAVARVVTGCPASTPVDALMAEAGMLPAGVQQRALATRMLGLAASLPPGDP